MLYETSSPFKLGCGARTAASHSFKAKSRVDFGHLPRYHGPPVEFPDRYTLLINSYERHNLLERAISHYSKCSLIDTIRVVWCEDGLPPTRGQAPGLYSELKEVRFDVMPNPSLNSRFSPLEGIRTEAVFSIDDDIQAPCSEADRLFQVWKSNRRNLVGFYPRLHVLTKDCSYKYLTGFGTLTWWGLYSMVLTKAAFLHRDYLEHYSNHMDKAIHAYVDSVRNCEDLAMSFLVANSTGQAPIFMHSSWVVDLGKGMLKVQGISSGINHNQERSACLNHFAQHYGGAAPLVVRSLQDDGGGVTADDPSHSNGVRFHAYPWWLRISPQLDAVAAALSGHF